MNVKGFSYRAMFSLLLAAGMAASCTMYYVEEPVTNREGNAVRLSLSVGNHEPSTKQSADITQDAEGAFRGIDNLVIIPFATQGEVNGSDARLVPYVDVNTTEISSLISGSNAVFYDMVSIPGKTSSFLVYGKAVDSGSDPMVNGSLITSNHFYDNELPSAISFSPDPIYGKTTEHEHALALANYLTELSNTTVDGITAWKNATTAQLKNWFNYFTNDGKIMGGSSRNIAVLLTKVYQKNPNLRNAINNATYVSVEGSGVSAVVSLKEPYNNFPEEIGLPDGAAGIKWNSSTEKFEVKTQTSTDGNIMSTDRYCYPANLWYYTNSRIKTSDVDDEKNHYVAGSTWGGILGEYNADDSTVSSNVTAVAIKEPLNYGVGHLEMKVKCESSLKDNGDAHTFNMTASSTEFPLTGIMIGQQRAVGYNFEPLATAPEFTVYDNNIGTNYLQTTLSAATHTLALQTRKGEKVFLILEFENNADDFVGANGTIFKGMKFYLTGTLKLDDATSGTIDSIFKQDYKTQVIFNVKSLENAWNIVPDLRSAQLEVGVQLEVEWIQATSYTGVMY